MTRNPTAYIYGPGEAPLSDAARANGVTRATCAREWRAFYAACRAEERDARFAGHPGGGVDYWTGAGLRQNDLASEIDANRLHTFTPQMADTRSGRLADIERRRRAFVATSNAYWEATGWAAYLATSRRALVLSGHLDSARA